MAQSDARARLLSQASYSQPESVVLNMFSGYRKGGQTFVIERTSLVVLTNDYSMETALSRRGGPGEFMRTVGGMPAIAAGWEMAYRHNTVR